MAKLISKKIVLVLSEKEARALATVLLNLRTRTEYEQKLERGTWGIWSALDDASIEAYDETELEGTNFSREEN